MYQDGLVAVVKVDGKVLRETKEIVFIPFGSEYSILVKNLKSKRILVKVSIDGVDAFDGTEIVIPPNSEIELERFIKSGNLNSGNKFKFIERTEVIENHRGVKVDDGLIRIEYWVEKITPVVDITVPRYHYYDVNLPIWRSWPYYSVPTYYYYPQWIGSTGLNNASSGDLLRSCNTQSSIQNSVQCNSLLMEQQSVNDAGITVAGSESKQQFTTTSYFPVHSESEVLIIKLCGKKTEKVVKQPITVQTKKKCVTCGKINRSNMTFCPQCGTALSLI